MAYSNIKDPSAHFQTKVYTGTNANQSITNDGNSDLQPDWIFASYRTLPPYTNHRVIIDSSRGRAKILESDTSTAEATTTNAAYDLVSFDTDGFTVGPVNSTSSLNAGNTPTVAWQWKANGGTTTSKSSGTVAGNVTTPCVQQVNTDAGFSILTYTASTSYAGTETHLEHGLGVGPKVLIVKRRDTAGNWNVYHAGNGASPNAGYGYLLLNTTNATQVASPSNQYWLNTPAESNATLLALGAENGANGGQYVCYAFAEKQGYSKFGSYVGNGNADGPFIYTGFKPAWVMVKRSDAAGTSWAIFDNKRSDVVEANVIDKEIAANESSAEYDRTNANTDFLSNGFKIRNTDGWHNTSNGTYIYMAFAENPFVAGGIPTTAR